MILLCRTCGLPTRAASFDDVAHGRCQRPTGKRRTCGGELAPVLSEKIKRLFVGHARSAERQRGGRRD